MFRIRRFGIIRTATVVAVIYMLAIAIFLPFVLLVVVTAPRTWPDATVVNVLLGGIAIALVYGVIGWIFTAIACAIYNLAARWVGGIEVQVEPVQPSPAVPSWGPTYGSTPPSAPTPPATPTEQG